MVRLLAAGIALLTIATMPGRSTLAAERKPAKPSQPQLSQRAKDYLDLVEKSETSKNHYETIGILELNDDDFRAVVPELIVMLRNRSRLRTPRAWGGSRPDRVCDRALAALDLAADKSLGHFYKSGRFSESELDAEAEQIIADVTKWWEANREKTQEDRVKERLARCPKRPGGGWDLDNFTIHALASGCHKDAAEILLQTLESDAGRFERERPWSPSMAASVVDALGKLGDKRVVPRLVAVAKKTNKPQNDEYGSLPEALVTTLNVLTGLKLDPIEKKSRGWVTRGGMTGPRDVEVFDYTIKPAAFDIWLKAAEAQGKTGAAAIPPLLELLKEEVWWVHQAAAEALEKIGPPAVPALLAILRDKKSPHRWCATRPLGIIKPAAKETIAALTEVLRDKDEDARYYAAQALGNIGPDAKDAVPALTELLRDKAGNVRASAACALGQIGPAAKSAVPALTRLLKDKEEWYIRPMAASALGDIGPAAKEAVPALTELLKDKEPPLRKIATEALQKIENESR